MKASAPSRGRPGDLAIGLLLAAAWLGVLLATVRGVGCVRDEGFYFHAASLSLGWFERVWEGVRTGRPLQAFGDPAIRAHFAFNAEHPVLLKNAFGLSWKLFHQKLGWVGHSTGYRIPGMAMAALMLLFTWLLAARAHGRRVALGAVLLLAAIPRLFHDSHLACFDVGITAISMLVVYAWWRALDDARWGIVTGVAWGLALATKLNAFFLPPVLLAHALLRGNGAANQGAPVPGARRRVPPVAVALASMAVLGPLVFVAHWPLLWHDTAARLGWYLRFHLNHEHYPIEYFGQVLYAPPFPPGTWAFPIVMTWVTVPLATVLLMTAATLRAAVAEGFLATGRTLPRDEEAGDPKRTRLLLLLTGVCPIALIALPNVPIFGGVKHWFPAMPPLAILASAELDRIARSVLRGEKARRVAFLCAVGAAAVTGALGIQLVHPYGIGFYNEAIGSIRGGAEHGMMRNFWGYVSRAHLEYLNRNVEPGGKVFFQRTNYGCYLAYREEGLLRPDIRYASSLEDAEWALVFKQRTFDGDEYRIWSDWGTSKPVAGLYVDEVPMCLVYRRERRR